MISGKRELTSFWQALKLLTWKVLSVVTSETLQKNRKEREVPNHQADFL